MSAMHLFRRSGTRYRLPWVLALLGTAVLAAAVPALGQAAQTPGSLYMPVDLTCSFVVPTVGTKVANIPMPFRFTFPTSTAAGRPMSAQMALTYTVLANGAPLGEQMAKYGITAITFEGGLSGAWTGAADTPVDARVTQTLTPPPTGDWTFGLSFTLDGTPTRPGEATFAAAAKRTFTFNGTPLQADGTPSGLGNITASCDLATGQDPMLFSVPVV